MLYSCEMQCLNSCGSVTSVIFQSLVFCLYELFILLCRDHLDLLERNNQLILELKHLDSTPAQRYINTYTYTAISTKVHHHHSTVYTFNCRPPAPWQSEQCALLYVCDPLLYIVYTSSHACVYLLTVEG